MGAWAAGSTFCMYISQTHRPGHGVSLRLCALQCSNLGPHSSGGHETDTKTIYLVLHLGFPQIMQSSKTCTYTIMVIVTRNDETCRRTINLAPRQLGAGTLESEAPVGNETLGISRYRGLLSLTPAQTSANQSWSFGPSSVNIERACPRSNECRRRRQRIAPHHCPFNRISLLLHVTCLTLLVACLSPDYPVLDLSAYQTDPCELNGRWICRNGLLRFAGRRQNWRSDSRK